MGRSQGATGAAPLLEREVQLATIEAALGRATGGNGAMVAIEGAAGMGKTSLLEAGERRAAAAGMTVLAAQGEDLERGLPWGLARRLLGPALTHPAGSALADGAAPAASLFDRTAPTLSLPGVDAVLAVSHALVWAIANLAEETPVALCVDDAHWADDASLRMLTYLLGRLRRLPVAVLLARRPRGAGVKRPLLEAIFADPRVDCLALEPLSLEAVATIVRGRLGTDADSELVAACAEMTAGNPFYLHELLLELDSLPDGLSGKPPDLERVAPESVSRAVFVRLARLGPEGAALARSVAILGEGAAFAHAAELAGLEHAIANRAFDALAIAEILRAREPLGFVHPLVAQAILAEIPAGERGELHRAAAHLLTRDGVRPEAVAVHLTQAGGRGDEWTVATLRAAAAQALAQGATETAADWLGRALAEPPPAALRGALLGELGRAEAALGRPQAIERLEEAADLAEDQEAARNCADLGRALALQGRTDAAAAAFERGLEQLEDPGSELGKELRAAWWSAATLVATMRAEAMRAPAPTLPAAEETPTPGERQLLAQLAMQRAFEGHERTEVTALAERAWGEGELLAAAPGDGVAWSLVSGALLVADEVERGLEVCDAALADARRRGSPMAFANASYCRAWPLFARGRVSDSVADSEAAVAAREDGWSAFLGTATAMLVMGLVERGEPAAASEALALIEDDEALRASTQYPMILVAAARLLVAEGRPDEALAQLLGAGEMLTAAGMDCPSAVPWRADAALAAGLAGKREQARELAAGALAAARHGGAPTAIARTLRAAARAEQGARAIELHREALATLADLPPRLERTHVLIDLGAALRRNRRRAEARDLLREGLADAVEGGALALAETARVELAAAGARSTEPRDGLAALTPSERRVAEMAAAGMTNRAIAQALFVTVKAIEYHLANSYRKLDINSRRQLGPLLAGREHDDGARSDKVPPPR